MMKRTYSNRRYGFSPKKLGTTTAAQTDEELTKILGRLRCNQV